MLFAFLSLAADTTPVPVAYLFTKYETIIANVSNESLISYLMFIHLVFGFLVMYVRMRAHFLYIYFPLPFVHMYIKPMFLPFPLAKYEELEMG